MLHDHAPTIFAFAAGLIAAGAPLFALWRRDARAAKSASRNWARLSAEMRSADARTIAGLRRRALAAEAALAERAVADALLTGPEMAVL